MTSPLPRTLSRPVSRELVVKRSRFLAHLAPVRSTAEADDVVAGVRRQSWDARHHCVAVVLGVQADVRRSADDGEPSGTAGAPMLEVLTRRRMTDVVAVVTRWFGGVLLGTGGLVRAYSGSVAAALDEAASDGVVLARRRVVEVTLDAPHADAGRLEHLLREWTATHGGFVAGTRYAETVRMTLLVPPAEVGRLHAEVGAATAGTLRPVVGTERVVDAPA